MERAGVPRPAPRSFACASPKECDFILLMASRIDLNVVIIMLSTRLM